MKDNVRKWTEAVPGIAFANGEVPAHLIALTRNPIDTSTPKAKSEIEERFEALLSLFDVKPTPDGWRNFAILIAATFVPALTIVDSRELKESEWYGRSFWKFHRMLGLVAGGKSIHSAATEIAKSSAGKIKAKSLEAQFRRWKKAPPKLPHSIYEGPAFVEETLRRVALVYQTRFDVGINAIKRSGRLV